MNPKSQSKRNRLGLYRRVSLLAVVAVSLLVVGFATATYFVTRDVLLDRQEKNFLAAADSQAVRVEDYYLAAQTELLNDPNRDQLLLNDLRNYVSGLSAGSGIQILLRYDGQTWVSQNALGLSSSHLDPRIINSVSEGTPAIMRYRIDGDIKQVLGAPLANGELWYFGVETAQDTVNILNTLVIVIVIGAVIVLIVALIAADFLLQRTFASLKSFVRAADDVRDGSIVPIKEAVDPEFEQLKHSFNSMQFAVNNRLERERQFALEVSHELKSPLTTVVLSAETLQVFREDMPKQAQQALDLLALEIKRFRRLLADLLEISKPPESLNLSFTAIDVENFLSEMTNCDIPVEIEGQKISFEGDVKLLTQAFANLLENAREYAGGAAIIKAWIEDNSVFFSIEDRGPGISEHDREKIFERFTRGTAGLRQGAGSGTGLGLAIAKERVQQHRGDIWVENISGHNGARFIMKLPLVQPRYPLARLDLNANHNKSEES